MKFGRNVHRHHIPEWTDFYFDYNAAKKLFKSACIFSREKREDIDLTELFIVLRDGVNDIEAFYTERLLNTQRRIDQACDYWGLPLEIPSTVNLDHVDIQELGYLLVTYLELQDLLNRLKNFGNTNRESFHRICCKIRKAQALSNNLHFNDLQFQNAKFANQKQCLRLLEQCELTVFKIKDVTSNSKSVQSQLSLFLQNFYSSPYMSSVHPGAAYLAIKNNDFTALGHLLEQQDGKIDEGSTRSASLLLALLEFSIKQGSMKSIEVLLSRLSLKDQITVDFGNSLHHLTASIGRMRRGPNQPDHDALVLFVQQIRSSQGQAFIAKDTFQCLPLHYAALYGLSDLCQEYLIGIGEQTMLSNSTVIDAILAEDIDGYTPLSLAVIRGHTFTTEVFLRVYEEKIGRSEMAQGRHLHDILGDLLGVALKSGFDQIARVLIAHHANINSRNAFGETVLYIASREGHDDLVRTLLDPPAPQRIDIDLAENTRGWTPLFIACVEGHLSTVEYLLEAGANPRLCDCFGWTPKEHAIFRGYMRMVELFTRFSPNCFSSLPHSTALKARTVVIGTSLICSTEKRQVTASELKPSGICRSRYVTKDLESQILVKIGPSNSRNKSKAVDLEGLLNPHPVNAATHIEVGYLLEVSAVGASGTTKTVHLPILEETINEPWILTARDPKNIKLLFSLFRVRSYGHGAKTIIGSGIALLGSLKQELGLKRESLTRDYTIPILGYHSSDFIASVTFSFLIVTPLPYPTTLSTVRHGFWRTNGFTQVVGHRGSGANSTTRTNLQIGENTIQSFLTAAALGAQCVEVHASILPTLFYHANEPQFDVQLTKDYIPVIFHDFLVMETGGDTPLHSLSFDQFMHLSKSQAPRGYISGMAEARYLEKTKNRENPPQKPRSHSLNLYDDYRSQDLIERMKFTEEGMQNNIKGNLRGHSIQEPSTTLKQLLTILPAEMAFNLEIKYPMLWEAEDRNMETWSFELNFFIDTILSTIFRYSNNRNITLSSFSPEICILLSIKQQEYPILFINKAGSVPTGDVRAGSLQEAIQFAKSWHLAGIVMLSDPFVMCPRLIAYAKGSGLVCGSYGNLNDEPECAMIQHEAGLDAIMVNKVRLISETFAKANG